MSRPLRIEFAGALYHLTSRGDGREDIYLGDEAFVGAVQKQLDPPALLNDIPSVHKRPVAKLLAEYSRQYSDRDAAMFAAIAAVTTPKSRSLTISGCITHASANCCAP